MCAENHQTLLAFLGRCDELVADTRSALAAYPDSADMYATLADAIATTGAPAQAVQEVNDAFLTHAPPPIRTRLAARDHMQAAALAGDFEAAERYGDEWRVALQGERQLTRHAPLAAALVDLYTETGRPVRAGAVATDFLARQPAWAYDALVDDDTLMRDPTPASLDAARLAHAIPAAQFRERLTSWVERMNGLTQPQFRPFVWLAGEADVAETSAEATDALRDLPSTGVPPYSPRERGPGAGRVFLLAGRYPEATDLLRASASRCDALTNPYGNTRAHELLGEALEQQGRVAEACEEYAAVARRWGHAKPRSVTAELATARARALSCSTLRKSP